MTLNTKVAVLGPVPLQDLFMECRRLIGAESGQWKWDDREGYDKDGSRTLAMVLGQGLPGWLMIDYRPDSPLRAEDGESYAWAEEEDGSGDRPRCDYEVGLDTGYAYRGETGENCNQLHARFVLSLAEWLAGKSSACKWKNEYTGEWHDPDDLAAFAEFIGKDGAEAQSWFFNVAQPAIHALTSEASSM